jgi:hypothetical protein
MDFQPLGFEFSRDLVGQLSCEQNDDHINISLLVPFV